jgi:hypothetical protein
MDERGRRQWAAAEARELGWGGVTAVAHATGLSRTTITAGRRELELPARQRSAEAARVRRPGGGRQRLTETDPGLVAALEALIEPATRGDPESPLCWTCKSTRRLADELTRQHHPISTNSVAALLRQAGYSLQANRKTREGASHPDRNAQFEHINASVRRFHDRGLPAISVDTKKKELVGDFKNAGREWQPQGEPEAVRVHDFMDKKLGKAIPYGVYDILNNQGWVSVGIDHDTARFAANSIRTWWEQMGRRRFPQAKRLLITADGGGSNSHRSRLWKVSLQDLADDLDPAGHEQVEQDRASSLQLHHPELARPSLGQPSGRGQFDRRHHDQGRPGRQGGARQPNLRNRRQSRRRGTGQTQIDASFVSWRVELHLVSSAEKMNKLFLSALLERV